MKKILSFVLALVLLMSSSVIFATAEQSMDYTYIQPDADCPGADTYVFTNPENWDEVYVYACGGLYGPDENAPFPGEKLEPDYDGNYRYYVAVCLFDTVIFNDGKDKRPYSDYESMFYDYCVEKLGEDSLYEGARVRVTDTLNTYDGTVLFTATSWEEPLDSPCNEIIGHNCVHRSATYSPYGLGVYVSTDDEIYTLKEALEKEILMDIYIDTGFKGFEFHRVSEDVDTDLMHKCLYAFGDRFGYNPDEGESIYCKPYGYVGEYAVFHAYYSHYAYPDMSTQEQIGDYYFYRGQPCGIGENNSVALYVMNPEGDVFTLYEAYTQGLVTDLEAVVKLTGGSSIFGDYGKRILELLEIDITADSWAHNFAEISAYYEGYEWYQTSEDGTVPDFVTVLAAQSTIDETEVVKRVGDCVVTYQPSDGPDEIGYFVYFPEEDKLYTLEEALEVKTEYIEEIVSGFDLYKYDSCRLIGDADGNSKINVKDATRIQKRIAGFDLGSSKTEIEASDFNGDGKVNVRDATAIQKFIAGLE